MLCFFLWNLTGCFYAYGRHFAAVDAKSLRVSISSFYDFLAVSLKCLQEFEEEEEEVDSA